MNTIIAGFGVTGKATSHILGVPKEHCYDSNREKPSFEIVDYYKYCILCLPTPTVKRKQDISVIEEWLEYIKKNDKEMVVIIRSTILPGTTDKLSKKYGLQIAHVPEFLTEATALEDAKNPEFLVVGARDILLKEKVKKLFLSSGKCHPKKVILTDPVTAEMIKYTMNSFFALKVIYANQLWDIAKEVGANYSKLREALETHKWGSKNGWDVWHKAFRGFSGKCLPKDLDAFTNAFDIPLLLKVKEINDKLLKNE